MCNLNVIVVIEFISRDLYLLYVILLSSKFRNSIFYQHMRPKSGLKFPRPLCITHIHVNHGKFMVNLCYTSVTHSVYAFITHFVLCSPKANCVPPEMSFSVPGLKI